MSVRTYNPSVRVGNWNEDLWLEEDLLKDFIDKRDRNELLILKAPNLSNNILQPVKLSSPKNGKVCFGDIICVHNPHTAENLTICMSNKLYDQEAVSPPCGLTCSKMLQPSYRNAFVVTKCEDDSADQGDYLRYGQQFYLRTLEGVAGSLNVFSERATLCKSAKKSRYNEITLTKDDSYGCRWHILNFDPQKRLETEGIPVPVNTKFIVMHSKTNEALAALEQYRYTTPLVKEHEVVTHTFLDSHKAEEKENHWVFVANGDEDDQNRDESHKR